MIKGLCIELIDPSELLGKYTPNHIRELYGLPRRGINEKLEKQCNDQWDAFRYAMLNGGSTVEKTKILFSDLEQLDVIEVEGGKQFIYIGDYMYDKDLNKLFMYPSTPKVQDAEIRYSGNRAVKVFKTDTRNLKEAFIPFNLKLRIAKIEPKKMKISEIEEALGYPVEIVREEN